MRFLLIVIIVLFLAGCSGSLVWKLGEDKPPVIFLPPIELPSDEPSFEGI